MIKKLKDIITDLLVFYRNPIDEISQIQSKSEKAKTLFCLLIIDIPIMGILIAVISGLEKLGLFSSDSNKIFELIRTMPIWVIILFGVFILPFFEELVFRLFLRYKRNYIFQFVISIVSITGKSNKAKVKGFFDNFWIKRYGFIFYTSAIIFGFTHLTNYKFSYLIIIFSPIIIAPQLVAGTFFGYLRVRYGFIWGYYMHAIHNVIFLCIPLIFMSDTCEKLNLKTDIYSVKIEETYKKSTIGEFNINQKDTIACENITLKSALSFLLDKPEIQIKSNDDNLLNKRINLYVKKKVNDSTHINKWVCDQLVKLYDFKLINKVIPSESWDLIVDDNALLTKYLSDSTYENGSITNSQNGLSIKNLGIDKLVLCISQGCNKHIVNRTDSKSKYNITVRFDDFEKMKIQLISKYGILLKKNQIMIEFTIVEFNKK